MILTILFLFSIFVFCSCSKPYHLVAVTIFKDESEFLESWIDHYIKEGVDHFYMLDHGSKDNYLDVIRKYPGNMITLVRDSSSKSTPSTHVQREQLLNKFFLKQIVRDANWVMVLGIDDYVYPSSFRTCIGNVLNGMEPSVQTVVLPWKLFGSKVLENNTPQDIIVNHLLRREQNFDFRMKSALKTIVRVTDSLRLTKHASNANQSVAEHFSSGDPFSADVKFSWAFGNAQPLQLNHYMVVSKSYFHNLQCGAKCSQPSEHKPYSKEVYDKLEETANARRDVLLARRRRIIQDKCMSLLVPTINPLFDHPERAIDLQNQWNIPEGTLVTADAYTQFKDVDGAPFLLKRLPSRHGVLPKSCYEVTFRNNVSLPFCYPQVHIPGHPKCGTSSMYSYLKSQSHLFTGRVTKELCPKVTYREHFKTLSDESQVSGPKIEITGCLMWDRIMVLHQILQPNAAYLYMVRDAAHYAWAAYNFWCIASIEYCRHPGQFTAKNATRSPEHFDQFVRTEGSQFSCPAVKDLFTTTVRQMEKVLKFRPLVVSVDALSSPEFEVAHLTRLEKYLNKALNASIVLDKTKFERVNSGALLSGRGAQKSAGENKTLSDGVYEISGFRPLLPQTAEYITSCWGSCKDVAAMSKFPYKCAAEVAVK
jgi:hypothetical protein